VNENRLTLAPGVVQPFKRSSAHAARRDRTEIGGRLMRKSRVLARSSVFAVATCLGSASVGASELVWARYGDIDSLDPHRATSTL
jgi:hypothetical protein